MRKQQLNSIILSFWFLKCVFGYKIFYMIESGSCIGHPGEINVGSDSKNSSGILMNAYDSKYVPGQNCTIFLRPPLSHGIVASIQSIDLRPTPISGENCKNYLELYPVEHHGRVRLCGYSYDKLEFKSYTTWGAMRVSFYTSNSSDQSRSAFYLTFTAVRNGNGGFCFKNEKRCHNHNCIWKGLTCDGHNNCGDLSDEIDKRVSQCAAMSPGESLAVILVTITGSLLLLVIAACLKGPKITRQIENLSNRRRSSNDPEIPVIPRSGLTSRNSIPSINRIRTNYGSTSQFLSSYDFSVLFYREPPPRYEEVQSPQQGPVFTQPVVVSVSNPPIIERQPNESSTQVSADTHPVMNTEVRANQVFTSRQYVDSNPPSS